MKLNQKPQFRIMDGYITKRIRKKVFFQQINILIDWKPIEKEINKLVSKKRWVVERTFGGIKRWFGATQSRYKGLDKTHTQHLLEAIAYNLY